MTSNAAVKFYTLIATAVIAGGAYGDEQPPSIATISRAWEARKNSITAVHFQWEGKRYHPAGGLMERELIRHQLERTKADPEQLRVPPADVDVTLQATFALNDSSIRFDYEYSRWSRPKNSIETKAYLSHHDGRLLRIINPDGSVSDNGRPFTDGLSTISPKHSETAIAPVWPITTILFANHSRLQSIAPTQFVVVGMTTIGGERMIELRNASNAEARDRLFVDPARGYCPRKLVTYGHRSGKIRLVIDVAVVPHPIVDWMPQNWSVLEHAADGSLVQSTKYTVRKSSINEPIPAEVFDLKPPVGAVTIDYSTQGASISIIKEDGSARKLSPAEAGRPYDEIVSLANAADRYQRRRMWLIRCAAVVAVLLASGVIYRYRQRTLHPSPDK